MRQSLRWVGQLSVILGAISGGWMSAQEAAPPARRAAAARAEVARVPESERTAADKATLVDKLLRVLDDDRTPAVAPAAPAEPTKPAAATKKKSKATKPKAPPAESAEESKSAKPKVSKKPTVVRFTLTGEYSEEPDSAGLLGMLDSLTEDRPTVFEIIERLDAASKDKEVSAVWLRFDEFSPARGNIHEFRAAIARLRQADKRVFAELHSGADAAAYQIAVACEKIFMPEGTQLELLGPRVSIQHYKGLLDKLGMQFDVLRIGRCKGAYEPFTHEQMSDEVRENYQALVDDMYDSLIETIADGRQLDAKKVRRLIDHGVYTPTTAQAAKLVDQVIQAPRLEEELQKLLSAPDGLRILSNYKKKPKEEITGMMDVMKLMMGGSKPKASGGKKKIAVVYETGEISTGKSGNSLFGGKVQGSTSVNKLLRKVADDPNVKAIVVRIDGPGGSATASDLIWQETMRTREKKPVISSMGSVAASGTYFTAVAGHKIFAEPDTLTGSIGVLGGKLVTQVLYQKLGINTEFIGRGALSGLEQDRPFTAEERKVLTEMVESCYRDFVHKVAQCRKLSDEKVAELAEGRVYTARQAQKLGLVDELGTLNDAIAAAKQAAGLKPEEEVEIVRYPEERSIFEILSGDRDGEAAVQLAAQAAGIPASVLRRLPIPAFFLRPQTSGRPHLYYWSPMPQVR